MKTRIAEGVGKYSGQTLEEVIPAERIQARIAEMAEQIAADYRDKNPIFIGVLNGAVFFFTDLLRRLPIPCEIDFVKVSSYFSETKSSGTVRLLKDISCIVTNRHIVIVEDIIDSGLTANFLRHRIQENDPASVAFAALLIKPDVMDLAFKPEYVGFQVENRFYVGYGLDLDQQMRNYPSIWAFPANMSV